MQEELDGREEMNRLSRQWLGEAAMGVEDDGAAEDGCSSQSTEFGEAGGRAATMSRRLGASKECSFELFWVAPADESLFLSIMNDGIENSRLPDPDRLAATTPPSI